jgi:squalene-associated FAD-dependent desaturase
MTIHIVGAGLAGLAAALRALESGEHVVLHEAAPAPGGRARSFLDPLLNRVIDNGTHVILGANRSVLNLIRRIDAEAAFLPLVPTIFSSFDLKTGQWHDFAPGKLRPLARGNPSFAADLIRLLTVSDTRTVADVLGASRHFTAVWEPLSLAILNTEAKNASARLFAGVVRRTLLAGTQACRAYVAVRGLSQGLAEPAMARIRALGGEIRVNSRLTGVAGTDSCVSLAFKDGMIDLKPADRVILALPAWEAARMITLPRFDTRAILNLHFRLDRPALLADGRRFAGLLGGIGQWLFCRGDTLSVTISAWDDWRGDEGRIAYQVWDEARRAMEGAPAAMPLHRAIVERRATIAHTVAGEPMRPPSKTAWSNFFLAGDYVTTGLPSTIEGAVLSGDVAARLAVKYR